MKAFNKTQTVVQDYVHDKLNHIENKIAALDRRLTKSLGLNKIIVKVEIIQWKDHN
jgi:ethanolamine utilization microcompartment shell protein EutS